MSQIEDPDADLRSLLSGSAGASGGGGGSPRSETRSRGGATSGGRGVAEPKPPSGRPGRVRRADGKRLGRKGGADSAGSEGAGAGVDDSRDADGGGDRSRSDSRSPAEMPQRMTAKRLLYFSGASLLLFALLGPGGPFFGSVESGHGDSRHSLDKVHPRGGDPGSGSYGSGRERGVHGDLPSEMASRPDVKAAGSRKHHKFGARPDRKKRRGDSSNSDNNNNQEDKIHSNIKEAIDNIDKVFLGKAPRQKGLRKGDENEKEAAVKTTRKGHLHAGNSPTEDDDALASTAATLFPVIHADDNALPSNAQALDAYTNSLPASDALECRASVIAFVINATDVRDECEGLRKAFDKTCSVNSNVAAQGGAAAAGRRRLRSWGLPAPFAGGEGSARRWIRRKLRGARLDVAARRSRVRRWARGDADDAFLFAEEEVSSPRVWDEARSAVEAGIDLRRLARDVGVRPPGDRATVRREAIAADPDAPSEAGKSLVSLAEERKAEDAREEAVPPPAKKEEETKISLLIPTSDEHMSEEMLNDALLLQEANGEPAVKPPASPPEADPNLPQREEPQPPSNNTASEEAARDAAESAEAIRTATDAVKNMMMDPKSVEARTCCASILSVFHEHCDPSATGVDDYSDRKLLVIVFVVTVCGIVKSVIRHFGVRWLPEAGGCILVGVAGYLILQNVSYVQYAFDGDMFLRIMVPPIVFEAAVKINKRSFQRHVVPITIYAIVGTLVSTALTATILYQGSRMVGWCPHIPVKESLIFGSLISSIDPIAVLSVLNNMGMTDSDTIYVLIFGESLLNDGIAIVLFQTLVHFLDESLVIDGAAVIDAIMHFVVVALGSLSVGVASGACATVYFAVMHGCQTPMVELISFLAWAFIPYFICDMVEWSGIVAIVANGFVMDLYVVGQRYNHNISYNNNSSVEDEIDFLVNGNSNGSNANGSNGNRGRTNPHQVRSFFNYEGHLSPLANTHVHFVIEIFATLMETAIFAYLGLFLFSPRYHWNGYLTIISIFATVMGRVIMIPILSHISNIVNRMIISRNNRPSCMPRNDINENVHVDRRMQLVLIFAGLRGAMSFALVEHIPLFDTITGQGSRLKPELKAMTSASIIFTVFVLGGATSYLMERIGYSISPKQQEHDAIEVTPLVARHGKPPTPNTAAAKRSEMITSRSSNSVRQRGSGVTR